MSKYLYRASYTPEGLKELLKDGGSKRRDFVAQVAKAMGISVEAFYFAFGDDDVYIIVDALDNATAAAGTLLMNAAGIVTVRTTLLMTPEETDEVVKMTADFRMPR